MKAIPNTITRTDDLGSFLWKTMASFTSTQKKEEKRKKK